MKSSKKILRDYTGELEKIGKISVGDQLRETHTAFRNFTDYEAYVNAIDEVHDAEDAIFKGYIYKINTTQFNLVNRSQYGNGCNFKQQINEYRSNNCYVPSNGYCFIKCIDFLTEFDYKEQGLDFIRSDQRRSNIMTMARIQPCLRTLGFNLDYYNGKDIRPRNLIERNKALFLHNNHFCLIWKSQDVSFNKTIEEVKENFKNVDNCVTEENVKSFFEYIYTAKRIKSHLTNFITYDLETHNTDRARHYVFCFYRLNKLAGKYNREITPYALENCKKDTIAFDGGNCVTIALDFCLKIKGELRKKKKNEIIGYNLQLHAHKGSGFDTWTVLNNLPCDKRYVIFKKNGKGKIELKVINVYIEKNKKQTRQYLLFRSGITHLNISLNKLRRTFKLQKLLLKKEMNHEEVDGFNYKDKQGKKWHSESANPRKALVS